MVELTEHDLQLILSLLEGWLDEYDWLRHEKGPTSYPEYEQLARKLGWKPRGED